MASGVPGVAMAAPPEPHDVADAIAVALCHHFATGGMGRGTRFATVTGVNEKALFGHDPDEVEADDDAGPKRKGKSA